MSRTPAPPGASRASWAKVLLVRGAVVIVASATVGYLWFARMPDLRPTDFGRPVQVTASATTSATVFVSTGLSRAPSCEVTSGNGAPVLLSDPARYRQGQGLESAFGFDVTSGTTYTVTCSGRGADGRMAVAQDGAVPQEAFVVAGSLGLLACIAGGVLTAASRPRRTAAQ